MIKVFLVEDEMIIRNAIKNSINWEREGYEFAGEASDGELAYPLILKNRPDLLITDIKMPFMDGLELSEAIKKELPDIKIILLSGYNDFDYAKKAISIGITDYLLKPISADKLLEAIGKVVEKIKKERTEKELLKKYSEEMQENTEREKYLLFGRMVTEPIPITEALEGGRRLGMNLSAELYTIILFKIMDGQPCANQSEQRVDSCVAVETYIQEMEAVYCFRRGVDGWALLCLAENEQEMQEKVEQIRARLLEIMEGYSGLDCFGGIGTSVTRLRNLKDSFHTAERAFAGRFTLKPNRIVYQESLYTDTAVENVDVNKLGSVEDKRELLEKFLRNGTEEETGEFIEACFGQMPQANLQSMMMRQYILMDMYISVATFGEGMQISKEEICRECGHMREVSEYAQSIEIMKKFTIQMVRGMILLRDTASGRRYSDFIESAQAFILQHYMSENISLNAVAESVNLSPSYFSSIFSQEVGKTFVEYLTEIRMEKAKELLMCSSMKTSEIGYEVGYKDAHYFSYIFKKTQKCTPKEYRTRGKL